MCNSFLCNLDQRDEDRCTIAACRKLKKIFKELAERCEGTCIDKEQFLRFADLPGLLGEQIFNALDEDEDNKLDVKEFVAGISALYVGHIHSVTGFLFKLFNFSKNGQISRVDMTCILEYLPKSCQKCGENITPDWDFSGEIEKHFGNDRYLFYEAFHDRVCELKELGELVLRSVLSLMPDLFDAIFIKDYKSEVLVEGILLYHSRKYYAKLRNKAIFYSVYKESQTKGIIFVKDLFIESDKTFGFILKNNRLSYEFNAESLELRNNWVEKLKFISDYRDIASEYKVTKEIIGKGAYGKVKLATCIRGSSEELFAVKIISKEPLDPRSQTRLRREISILKLCKHENIVKLCDVFENSKKVCIVTEYIQGGSLFAWLKTKNFKVQEGLAKILIFQLAGALKYLHSFGIFHRDIKLENILLDTSNGLKPKIIDFGLGCVLGPGQFSQEAVGTLKYASPELISRVPYRETPDVWGIGVIMYILLTGKAPFYGENDQEIANRILKKKIEVESEKWQGISMDAKEIVVKLLIRKPSDRMKLDDLLRHKWFDDVKTLDIEEFV